MNKNDFKIGQKVYLRIIEHSDAARGIDKSNPEAWVKEKIVTNIGRKYLTVTDDFERKWGEIKFIIDEDFLQYYTVGGADYELFLTKEDILKDLECEELYSQIKKLFSSWKNNRKYTFEQLKKIIEILD